MHTNLKSAYGKQQIIQLTCIFDNRLHLLLKIWPKFIRVELLKVVNQIKLTHDSNSHDHGN
jgi:hypothetical protein